MAEVKKGNPGSTATSEILENPYVAVVTKKIRNLRKKLKNIEQLETSRASGAILNEDQLITLGTKQNIERQIQDLDGVKTSLEDVVASQPPPPPPLAASSTLTPAAAKKAEKKAEYEKKKAAAVADEEKAAAGVEKGKDGKKPSPKTITSSTSTDVFTDSSAMKTAGTQASMKNEVAGSNKASIQRAVEKSTSRLLKALHVFRRYTDYTGCKLPDEVELFGMSLLGQITVSSFEDRLAQSVRTAGLYLDPVESKESSLSGMFTYREISNTIDKLSLEMEKDLNAPVADPSLEMQFGDVIVSDDPVDAGSTYGIFGPSTIPPPPPQNIMTAPSGNSRSPTRVKPPQPPPIVDDMAPPPYDPKAKPTAFKHPDLYSAVAPPADASSSGFTTIDPRGAKGDPRGIGVGKPTPNKATLDATRQRAIDAATFEKPHVDSKKNFRPKPGSSNIQNKAPQQDAQTNRDKKIKMKDDVPKQKKNVAPKPKQ